LHDELAGSGFTIVAVAFDDDPAVVRPLAEGITFPVLIDREHLLSELYAITNVPTVLWIDEDDRIARPNGVAFGTDMFADFTGVDSEIHKEAVRRWVSTGEVDLADDEARAAVVPLSAVALEARLEFRMAAFLRRDDRAEAAAAHFARAVELAPHDFTIRRAAMPLQGTDPFGEEFFAMYEQWQAAGAPYNGLPA